MTTLEQVARIGTKGLVADTDFLVKTLEAYLKEELKKVELRVKPIFCRPPTVDEFLDSVFGSRDTISK